MDYSIDRVSYRRSASRLTIGAHLFGILAIILLLVWLLHYRDGIEYDSDDPQRVFNVLIGESPSSPISYKYFNLLKKMNSNEWILEINYCSCLHRFTHFLCSAGLCSLPVKVRTFLLILPNPTMLTNHCFSYKFLSPNLFFFQFGALAAMMAYKTVFASRIVQKTVHMLLHLTAFCLGIVGLCAVFKYHDMAGLTDMYSLHSWIGMGTFCLFGLQVNEKRKKKKMLRCT